MKTLHLNRKNVFEELKKLPDIKYIKYSPTSIKSFPGIYLEFDGYKNIKYSIWINFPLTKKELDENHLFEQSYISVGYTHPITLIHTEYDIPVDKISNYEDYDKRRYKETLYPGSGYLPEFKSDEEFIEIVKQLISDINNHPWDKETFLKYGLHIQ